VPHPARVYAHWLGGKDTFEADRKAAQEVIRLRPEVVAGARENRAFLARVVRFLAAEAGIRQFLDIGVGLPADDNTHEVAQDVDPACRVVYVDNDCCKSGCVHAPRAAQGCLKRRGSGSAQSAPPSTAAAGFVGVNVVVRVCLTRR
jgi:hypothetical protein